MAGGMRRLTLSRAYADQSVHLEAPIAGRAVFARDVQR
jgi:hypothetical protein